LYTSTQGGGGGGGGPPQFMVITPLCIRALPLHKAIA
jgi:hypothetical protein